MTHYHLVTYLGYIYPQYAIISDYIPGDIDTVSVGDVSRLCLPTVCYHHRHYPIPCARSSIANRNTGCSLPNTWFFT